jgi:hypothetical protein
VKGGVKPSGLSSIFVEGNDSAKAKARSSAMVVGLSFPGRLEFKDLAG